ncbi:MAG: Mrp/NBP35 family ATP-binding protein [Brevirhabdus sp.]
MGISKEAITAALKAINDPATGKNVLDAGVVKALNIDGDTVRYVMEIEAERATAMQAVKEAVDAALKGIDGVGGVAGVMTAHTAEKAPPSLKAAQGGAKPKAEPPKRIAGVDRMIAIASGKGGVGKSTVTSNLAAALAAEGRKVGILDADIYGPSQPRMMGAKGMPESPDGRRMIPAENHGVKIISMGLMMREDEAVVWRGPMLMSALMQMLGQVEWGELDILLLDLPPGTGDVQITLAQKAALNAAIIVSTPQDVALLDARKGISMFRKVGTPIMGLIENMSMHVCAKCGHEEHLFGHGGVAEEARRQGAPLLGEIPLGLAVREGGDKGVPVVVSHPDSPQAQAFRKIAQDMIAAGQA